MLKHRVITALILAVVFATVILQQDSLWVRILFTGVMFAAVRELVGLTLKTGELPKSLIGGLVVMLFWWSLALVSPQLIFWKSLVGLGIWVLITLSLPFYRYNGNWPLLLRVVLLGLGLDLLWICGHGLIYLHQVYGGWMLLYMLTLVWVADIGAYFGGRRFGKHKLAPAISPGKTWEGVVGGMLTNLAWMFIVYLGLVYFQVPLAQNMALPLFLAIGFTASAISIVGDLFESILKREIGVKDSGKLLPGHGGILDRIDSVIAATPVFLSGMFLAGLA